MWRRLVIGIVCLSAAGPLYAQNKHDDPQLEPTAGQWRTWVISSGKDYRVPPPPRPNATRAELRQLADLTQNLDDETRALIVYWDAGSPQDRWMEPISNRLLAGTPTSAYPHRVYTYVALAMYRRDRCRLGLEVPLRTPPAERDGSPASDRRGRPEQPVVSLRARRRGAGSRDRPRLFPPERGGIVPVDGR